MNEIKWILAVITAGIISGGCLTSNDSDDDGGSDTDPVKAEQYVSSADSVVNEMMKLEDVSSSDILNMIEDAADYYKLAAEKDPDNGHANFGAALFSFQNMMNNQDMETINNTLEQWDTQTSTLDHPQYFITQIFMHGKTEFPITYTYQSGDGTTNTETYFTNIGPQNAFLALMYLMENSLSEQNTVALIQNTIDNTLITTLDNAIGYIDNTLAASSFSYVLKKEDTGDIQDWEFDKGEAYMLSAMLRAMRASLKIMNAYQLSVPGATGIVDYSDETELLRLVKAADVTNGPFLKLRNTSILPTARQDLVDAMNNIKSGISFITSETDAQTDDIIKQADITEGNSDIDDEVGVSDNPVLGLRNVNTINELADQIKNMLTGPFDVEMEYNNGTKTTVSINLNTFLNNGIPDFKKVLPYHGWRDLNSLEKSFSGYGVDMYGEQNVGGVEYSYIYMNLPSNYAEAMGNDDLFSWNEYLGTISADGVMTISKKAEWNYTGYVYTDMQPNENISSDGAIHLDSQLRLCITPDAYNTLNTWARTASRDTWTALDQLLILNNLPSVNYSPEHPFGVRDTSSSVFKFAGTPRFTGNIDPVFLTNSSGTQLDPDTFPIFPDPTLGGVLPGMTQSKLESFSE